MWYTFRRTVAAHVCSSLHENALIHQKKHESHATRDKKVTELLVKTTLSGIKAKMAARHFTPLLSLLHSINVDVGDISHSQQAYYLY